MNVYILIFTWDIKGIGDTLSKTKNKDREVVMEGPGLQLGVCKFLTCLQYLNCLSGKLGTQIYGPEYDNMNWRGIITKP